MKKSKLILSIVTLACLGLGFLFGFLTPDFSTQIKFFGDWYVDTLKIIIGPIIFVSIFLTVLNREKKSSLIILKTVGLFIGMFLVTFLITSGIIAITGPGKGFVIDNAANSDKDADFGILSIFKNLLPQSIESFFKGGCIFFVIVLAFAISFPISFTPIREKTAKIFEIAKEYLGYVLKVVLFLTPLAVISLVSNSIVKYGGIIVEAGLKYILFAWGCSIIALLLVMILPVWLIAKINPITYIKKVSKVWLVSLSSCSSVATLPHTIRCCNEDFGIDEKITDVVVPLGCTIHMCGGAVSFALLGLFVSQMSGVPLTFGTFMLMILSATLINMAAPGIPGGGRVIGISYLSILGLPIEGFYGFYNGIYSFLDMAYTTLNVTGDVSANIILNHFENKKEIASSNEEVVDYTPNEEGK